jgi:hypothetical protein
MVGIYHGIQGQTGLLESRIRTFSQKLDHTGAKQINVFSLAMLIKHYSFSAVSSILCCLLDKTNYKSLIEYVFFTLVFPLVPTEIFER